MRYIERTGFMCKVDFEHEVGVAKGAHIIASSVEELKKRRRCVDRCGIVEVEVKLVRVVQESNFDLDS